MKYTIPYDDKITLPHIKKIDSIGINADNLYYDSKELMGEVVIKGDYLLDNSQDVMEFYHDIPVSFLIDDESIKPQINISNFKYELIPGRGIEVMFDLDVILTEKAKNEEVNVTRNEDDSKESTEEKNEEEELKEFQEKIDENLDNMLQKGNQKIEKIEEEKRDKEENDVREGKETIDNKLQKENEREKNPEIEDVRNSQETLDMELEEERVDEKTNKEETEETVSVERDNEVDETNDYIEDVIISTNLEPTIISFDTGFVPRDNDKFTTYKILLIENNETIDDVLEARNLSRAFICKDYQFNEQKIVLRIENE